MQTATIIVVLAAAALNGAPVTATQTNPLSKVIELLTSLEAKITKEGEAEEKTFAEYIEWCDDETKSLGFEIKTLTAKKGKLEAAIAKLAADIGESDGKIEELVASIAQGEADLKNATLIREKENADFLAGEAELVDSVDVLSRAIAVITREMAKNPALVQVDTTNLKRLVQSMTAVIDAAAFSVPDKDRLLSLVQSREDPEGEENLEADEKAMGAPAAAVYKTHSTSIVEVLEDLKEKAEAELADLRKAETNAQHNYNMLKQSLEDQMKFDEHDLAEEKDAKAAALEEKATAEGDLAETIKSLAAAEEALETARRNCMEVAADHEKSVTARTEELNAIAEAQKILSDTSAGAVAQTYSLLQVAGESRLQTRADLANLEVVSLLKHLAEKHHSAALAQLASRVTAVMRLATGAGDDPFVKVRGLIQDLIDRLIKQGEAEATEKAYCDETMAKTEAKKSDLEDDIAKLTAKIDKATAASAALKEEVKALQAELAELAKQQAEMNKIRAEENADFLEAKTDLELGLQGVRRALTVLREYYGAAFLQQPPKPEFHAKASGAGGSIIDILEVVEADFAKTLAEKESAEADAQAEYEKTTQENAVLKTLKEQDVKYKTKEYTTLDKELTQMAADRDSSNEELSSVLEFYEKLKDRCIAKPETYEERKRRREAEIAGLKEALKILESETALMQRDTRTGLLRR